MPMTKQIDNTRTYFSRAGKASLSKFKILMDKEKILKGEKIPVTMHKIRSEPQISEPQLGKMIAEELDSLKSIKADYKPLQPSAVFLSPGRKEIFPISDNPVLGHYAVNYSLVEKSPITYSISKHKKNSDIPNLPDTFLSTNLHQFPDQNFKGIPFQYQVSRKDLTQGQPSPHEERFKVHNLIPSSCSKYSNSGCPDMGKYAERKGFYKKKEFFPDYTPNKEYIMPKLAMDIKFKSMTERKSVMEDKEWPNIFDVNMAKQEKKTFIQELAKRQEHKRKVNKNREPRVFSPSNFLNLEDDL